jgi:hypothetical protein
MYSRSRETSVLRAQLQIVHDGFTSIQNKARCAVTLLHEHALKILSSPSMTIKKKCAQSFCRGQSNYRISVSNHVRALIGPPTNYLARVNICQDGSYCCDDQGNCCASKAGVFLNADGVVIGYANQSTSSSSMSSTSSTSTLLSTSLSSSASASPTNPVPETQKPSSDNHLALGIALPVVLVSVAALAIA